MTHNKHSRETWEHPLIRTLDCPMNRRSVVFGGVALTLLPAARAIAQEAPGSDGGTPEVELEGDEDAVSMLESAAKAVSELSSFAFELRTTRGKSTVFQGLELKHVEGVVRRPMDIEATVTVGLPIGDITVSAVGLDGEFWVQDPLSDGGWMSIGSDPQLQSLINPDTLLLYAVRLVKGAEIIDTEKVGGVETTMVEGTVDFSGYLEGYGREAGQFDQFLAPGSKDVTFWIDEEYRVVEGEIRGPVFASESGDVVRVVSLFDFNEPVEIERPEGV